MSRTYICSKNYININIILIFKKYFLNSDIIFQNNNL